MSFAIGILGYIIVFAVLAVIGFFLLKSILKAIAIAAGIMMIVTLIFGLMVMADVKSLSEKMKTDNKIILLSDGSAVLAGATIGDVSESKDFTAMMKDGTIKFSTNADAAAYSASLADKDYDALLGANYKLILIDVKAFDSVSEVELFGKLTIPADEAKRILKSDTPVDTFLSNDANLEKLLNSGASKAVDDIEILKQNKAAFKSQIISQLGSEEAIKAMIAVAMFQSAMQKDPAMLISEYQKGNIKVYKETITFKLLNYMPVSLMKVAAAKMQPAAG